MEKENNRDALVTIKAALSHDSDEVLFKLIKYQPLNDGSGLNSVSIGSVKWHDLAHETDDDFPRDGATFRIDYEVIRKLLRGDEMRLDLKAKRD